jgi:transposase-like protein
MITLRQVLFRRRKIMNAALIEKNLSGKYPERRKRTPKDVRIRHVNGWHKSGLSQKDYALLHGLSPSNLRKWAMSLAATDGSPGFKPLKIIKTEPTQPRNAACHVEILVGNSVKIRLQSAQDVALITGIVRGLMNAAAP